MRKKFLLTTCDVVIFKANKSTVNECDYNDAIIESYNLSMLSVLFLQEVMNFWWQKKKSSFIFGN